MTSAGIRLVSGIIPGSNLDTSGPRLTVRLQGRTKMGEVMQRDGLRVWFEREIG
jgi:hypothetical protein